MFPLFGYLPPTVRGCNHPTLGNDQCQLIVGTLMQVDRFGKRGNWPHQCEVLRFYASASTRDLVKIERLLVGRRLRNNTGQGFGPYGFVNVPGRANDVVEEMEFPI
jgi:hypothetical protein